MRTSTSRSCDDARSLNEGRDHGARLPADCGTCACSRGGARPRQRIAPTKKEREAFLHQEPTKVKSAGANLTPRASSRVSGSRPLEGLRRDAAAVRPCRAAGPHGRVLMRLQTRLTSARSSKGAGSTSPRRARCRSTSLARWCATRRSLGRAAPRDAARHARSFVEIGLGYLSLYRRPYACRWRCAAHEDYPPLGSSLTTDLRSTSLPSGCTHDLERMNGCSSAARQGNTFSLASSAAGDDSRSRPRRRSRPRAGDGGRRSCSRATCGARASARYGAPPERVRSLRGTCTQATGVLECAGPVRTPNDVRLDIPLGVLVVSGRRVFCKELADHFSVTVRDGVVTVHHRPSKRLRRSNPARQTGS